MRDWTGENGQRRADTEAGPATRTSKYARRPMPKVDSMVPGQHLREDVLVGGFSKSTPDRCRSRTMMTRMLHLSKSGFNYTYWLGSTKKLVESIPGCRGRSSYKQSQLECKKKENRKGRGKEWDSRGIEIWNSLWSGGPSFILVVTLFYVRGQVLAAIELCLHPFGVGRPFGLEAPGDLQNWSENSHEGLVLSGFLTYRLCRLSPWPTQSTSQLGWRCWKGRRNGHGNGHRKSNRNGRRNGHRKGSGKGHRRSSRKGRNLRARSARRSGRSEGRKKNTYACSR